MSLERYLHGLWSASWLDWVAAATAGYGLYLCVVLLIVAWVRQRPRGAILPFALAAFAAAALDALAGLAYHDQRPFVTLGVAPLIAHGGDNGFPSDHSAAAAFIAIATAWIDPALGIVACVIAVGVGIARLFCLVHLPIDVLVGWAIGAVPAVVAGVAWRRRAGTR